MKHISKVKLEQLMKKKKKVYLVDMRSPVSFRDGHVDGAINLPLRNFVNALIGLQRDTIIVAYGQYVNDSDLGVGLNYAQEMGFGELYYATYDELK